MWFFLNNFPGGLQNTGETRLNTGYPMPKNYPEVASGWGILRIILDNIVDFLLGYS
jgi:hypothetical protein